MGHRGRNPGARPCSSASTSTRSTTRAGSRCRPASVTRSPTASSSRRGSTAASTSTRATTWEETVVDRIGSLDPLLPDTRLLQRHFFGGASEDVPDKQGRVHLPAPLVRAREARQGRHGGREQRPPRDLGPRRLGGAPGGDRRERRQCCPTSCRTAHLITLPSSRTRCARCSPCSRARRSSTPRSARAATRACSRAGPAGQRQARRDRPRPDRQAPLRPLQGPGGVDVRFLRGDFAVVLGSSPRTRSRPTRSCSTSASRRCRSTGRSAASPTRPTRRSTCAWTRRAR